VGEEREIARNAFQKHLISILSEVGGEIGDYQRTVACFEEQIG